MTPRAKTKTSLKRRLFGSATVTLAWVLMGSSWAPLPSEKADFGLRILNPDGSEAEKSGNGLRIFARYLRDSGKVGTKAFTVDTLGGVVTCEVSEDASVISVEMGGVSFHSDVVPVRVSGEPRDVVDEPIEIGSEKLRYYACLLYTSDAADDLLCVESTLCRSRWSPYH